MTKRKSCQAVILKSIYSDLPPGFSAMAFEESPHPCPGPTALSKGVRRGECGSGHRVVVYTGKCLFDILSKTIVNLFFF